MVVIASASRRCSGCAKSAKAQREGKTSPTRDKARASFLFPHAWTNRQTCALRRFRSVFGLFFCLVTFLFFSFLFPFSFPFPSLFPFSFLSPFPFFPFLPFTQRWRCNGTGLPSLTPFQFIAAPLSWEGCGVGTGV